MINDETLDRAIGYYAAHTPNTGGMAFINDATIAATLELLRELKKVRHPEPAAPRAGIPGPVSISYGTAQDALEAMEKLAEQGAYKHLRADDASFVRRALAELRSVLNRPSDE